MTWWEHGQLQQQEMIINQFEVLFLRTHTQATLNIHSGENSNHHLNWYSYNIARFLFSIFILNQWKQGKKKINDYLISIGNDGGGGCQILFPELQNEKKIWMNEIFFFWMKIQKISFQQWHNNGVMVMFTIRKQLVILMIMQNYIKQSKQTELINEPNKLRIRFHIMKQYSFVSKITNIIWH